MSNRKNRTKSVRHRLRNHKLSRRHIRRRTRDGDSERGRPHHGGKDVSLSRCLHQRRTTFGWRIRETPSNSKPRRNNLRNKTKNGNQLQSHRLRKRIHPTANFRVHTAENQERRRNLPGRHQSEKRSSRFQRTSTTTNAKPRKTQAKSPVSRSCESSTNPQPHA